MTTWIYPYKRLFGDVEILLRKLKVDGEDVPGGRIDADRQEVRLIDLERSQWSQAEIEVTLTGPLVELRELHEDGRTPRALALVHCAASNSRQAIELERDPQNLSRWQGTLELERSSWFGRLDLRGAIVDSVEGVGDRVIGEPAPWVLRLDDVPPPPVTGAIETIWQDFSDPPEGQAWLKKVEREPAFLRLDDDQPVLFLNSSLEGLKALLDRKTSREAAEQALHDQTRGAIAGDAWGAMFNASIQAIRQEDGEDPDWPEDAWKRTALEVLLELTHPDLTQDDALREVAEHRSDLNAGGPLQQQMFIAISKHVGAAALLRKAIKELNKVQ